MGSIELGGKKVEVADGSSITNACTELGIPFACREGVCGSCLTKVNSGMENLTELTQPEKDFGVSGDKRLACQCKLKSGDVSIASGY